MYECSCYLLLFLAHFHGFLNLTVLVWTVRDLWRMLEVNFNLMRDAIQIHVLLTYLFSLKSLQSCT